MALSFIDNITSQKGFPQDTAVIIGRAEFLDPADRDLLKAVFIHAQSISALSRIMGVNVHSLRAKIHRLCKRLINKRFINAGRALPYLDKESAVLAQLNFCQQVSVIELARRAGTNRYNMRRKIEKISAQIEAINKVISTRSPNYYKAHNYKG
jgi:hypothetical protein